MSRFNVVMYVVLGTLVIGSLLASFEASESLPPNTPSNRFLDSRNLRCHVDVAVKHLENGEPKKALEVLKQGQRKAVDLQESLRQEHAIWFCSLP